MIRAVYIDDNGQTTCREHAGAYLAAEINAAGAETPHFYLTPIGTWMRVTIEDALAIGEPLPACETCHRKDAA